MEIEEPHRPAFRPPNQLYHLKHTFIAGFTAPEEDCYIIHLKRQQFRSGSNNETEKLVLSSSQNRIKVYEADTLSLLGQYNPHSNSIQDLLFDYHQNNILYSASSDKSIKIFDLRSKAPTASLDTDGEVFSICQNPNNPLIFATGIGSNVRQWDFRKMSPFSTYSTHTEDVTQVAYRGTENELYSISVDGLVCSYTPTVFNEDDALLNVTNLDQSLSSLTFCGVDQNLGVCLTHTESLYLFSLLDGQTVNSYEDARKHLNQNYGLTVDYLISCHYDPQLRKLLLFSGNISGEFQVSEVTENDLRPLCAIGGGHTDIIRCAHYIPAHSSILTGGEDSRLCLWTPPTSQYTIHESTPSKKTKKTQGSEEMDVTHTTHGHKFKPY